MNRELPDVKAGFRKGEEPEIKLTISVGSLKEQESSRKNMYLWFTGYVKAFGIVNKAEIGVSLELSCFFDDPTDIGNLISGSSPFLKPA